MHKYPSNAQFKYFFLWVMIYWKGRKGCVDKKYTREATTLMVKILKNNKIYKTKGREIRNKSYSPMF
jgi:hypothetical protein